MNQSLKATFECSEKSWTTKMAISILREWESHPTKNQVFEWLKEVIEREAKKGKPLKLNGPATTKELRYGYKSGKKYWVTLQKFEYIKNETN